MNRQRPACGGACDCVTMQRVCVTMQRACGVGSEESCRAQCHVLKCCETPLRALAAQNRGERGWGWRAGAYLERVPPEAVPVGEEAQRDVAAGDLRQGST